MSRPRFPGISFERLCPIPLPQKCHLWLPILFTDKFSDTDACSPDSGVRGCTIQKNFQKDPGEQRKVSERWAFLASKTEAVPPQNAILLLLGRGGGIQAATRAPFLPSKKPPTGGHPELHRVAVPKLRLQVLQRPQAPHPPVGRGPGRTGQGGGASSGRGLRAWVAMG